MSRIFVKEKVFYKTVLIIAIPVILQQLITIGVNMMDTLMLGSYGEIQLSGSSLANDFINIFHFMIMGLGQGAAVMTSQYWGSKDITGFKKVTTIMLRFTLLVCLIFSAVTFLFPAQIMKIYTNDAAIIEKGTLYFRISALAYIPNGLSLAITNVLRSMRKVRVPLATSIVAFFFNVFFNWVFIFGHLGAPEMQIEGAALGTLISRLVEMAINCGYFFFVDREVGYRIKDVFMKCGDQLKMYVRYAVPVMISDTLLGFGNSALSMITGRISASYVAANSIIQQVVRMSTVFTQGLANAGSIMTGNTLGAGETRKAYRQGITFFALSVLIGIAAAGVVQMIAPVIISGFNINDETRSIAFQLMNAVSLMLVFQTANSVLTKGVLRGGGDTRFLMVADMLFLWIVSIPLGYLAALILHWPPFVIYCCLKADWAIKAVWCTIRLFRGKWIKPIKRNVTENEVLLKNEDAAVQSA